RPRDRRRRRDHAMRGRIVTDCGKDRTIARRLLVAAALAALALAAPRLAHAAACQSSGPASGAYTATVCIAAPADGGTATGATPVTGTVTFSGTSPSTVMNVTFYLGGAYLLSDFQAPYTFTLPSDRF